MVTSGFVAIASLTLGVVTAHAAEAMRPIDYTLRNERFSPAPSISPSRSKPRANHTLQQRRSVPRIVDLRTTSLGQQRAAVRVEETQPKIVREVPTRRVVVSVVPGDALLDRQVTLTTTRATLKPATVERYQASLAAASAANMARFPALEQGTSAENNQSVFRRDAAEQPPELTHGAPVIPAAGGAAVRE